MRSEKTEAQQGYRTPAPRSRIRRPKIQWGVVLARAVLGVLSVVFCAAVIASMRWAWGFDLDQPAQSSARAGWHMLAFLLRLVSAILALIGVVLGTIIALDAMKFLLKTAQRPWKEQGGPDV